MVDLFANDAHLFIEVEDKENSVIMIDTDLRNIKRGNNYEWLIQLTPEKTMFLSSVQLCTLHVNLFHQFCFELWFIYSEKCI